MRNQVIRIALVALVLGLTFVAGSRSRAQPPLGRAPQVATSPKVYSGADIGFRVEGSNRGVPSGKLVIRTDGGEWVEVDFAVGIKKLTSR